MKCIILILMGVLMIAIANAQTTSTAESYFCPDNKEYSYCSNIILNVCMDTGELCKSGWEQGFDYKDEANITTSFVIDGVKQEITPTKTIDEPNKFGSTYDETEMKKLGNVEYAEMEFELSGKYEPSYLPYCDRKEIGTSFRKNQIG